MRFTIQLIARACSAEPEIREVAVVERPDDGLAIDNLGLTLAEAKAMLAALQVAITDTHVLTLAGRERLCPCCGRLRRQKDSRTITIRTIFGKLALPSPRFARCRCEGVPGVAAPLVAALPERVTPDLLALEARWASLAAYGTTATLLADVLPIGAAVNASTIRNDVLHIAERLEVELGLSKQCSLAAAKRSGMRCRSQVRP